MRPNLKIGMTPMFHKGKIELHVLDLFWQQKRKAIVLILIPHPYAAEKVKSWCNNQWELMEFHDKFLWRRFYQQEDNRSHHQPLVPTAFLNKILDNVHHGAVSGNFGHRRTLSQLCHTCSFHWLGQSTDVQNCLFCDIGPSCTPFMQATPCGRQQQTFQDPFWKCLQATQLA